MQTSFAETKMKSEELMKDKNKLKLRWSSVLNMLCLRDLRGTTGEKSSEQEVLRRG